MVGRVSTAYAMLGHVKSVYNSLGQVMPG